MLDLQVNLRKLLVVVVDVVPIVIVALIVLDPSVDLIVLVIHVDVVPLVNQDQEVAIVANAVVVQPVNLVTIVIVANVVHHQSVVEDNQRAQSKQQQLTIT